MNRQGNFTSKQVFIRLKSFRIYGEKAIHVCKWSSIFKQNFTCIYDVNCLFLENTDERRRALLMGAIRGKIQKGLGESKNTVHEQMPFFKEVFPEVSQCKEGTINILLDKLILRAGDCECTDTPDRQNGSPLFFPDHWSSRCKDYRLGRKGYRQTTWLYSSRLKHNRLVKALFSPESLANG